MAYLKRNTKVQSFGLTPRAVSAPALQKEGLIYFNAADALFYIYSRGEWKSMSGVIQPPGGHRSTYTVGSDDYAVHLFLTSGIFSLDSDVEADYLAVAGGGGGGYGNNTAGGGGAGGFKTNTGLPLAAGPHEVVVGFGGRGGDGGDYLGAVTGADTEHRRAQDGSDTTIAQLGGVAPSVVECTGGGGGGGMGGAGRGGGSGGGGGSTPGNIAAGSAVDSGNSGNDGGTTDGPTGGGGGGGGAGAVGTSVTVNTGGAGGAGTASTYRDGSTSVTYAGGGGGGSSPDSGAGTAGAGGSGGGGAGGRGGMGVDGTVGTGGGGGGGSWLGSEPQYHGGNGGSGIVIIRYTI